MFGCRDLTASPIIVSAIGKIHTIRGINRKNRRPYRFLPAGEGGALPDGRVPPFLLQTYWQENADRNPPPPGTEPEPDVSVRIVPAATLLPAVAVHELPAPLAVAQLMIEDPAVQVVEDVLGFTLNSDHVVDPPE